MAPYWEETIALLQPVDGPQLVVKPTLKPDLLQKVPFKFLHDVITAVRSAAIHHAWPRAMLDVVGHECLQCIRALCLTLCMANCNCIMLAGLVLSSAEFRQLSFLDNDPQHSGTVTRNSNTVHVCQKECRTCGAACKLSACSCAKWAASRGRVPLVTCRYRRKQDSLLPCLSRMSWTGSGTATIRTKWCALQATRTRRYPCIQASNTWLCALVFFNAWCLRYPGRSSHNGHKRSCVQGKDEANANKSNFLTSILTAIKESLNEDIQCDVRQVIRGKDAEGANHLLQSLAKAADMLHMDGMEAVQVRNLRTPSPPGAWKLLVTEPYRCCVHGSW
jgi:hypothetical protein